MPPVIGCGDAAAARREAAGIKPGDVVALDRRQSRITTSSRLLPDHFGQAAATPRHRRSSGRARCSRVHATPQADAHARQLGDISRISPRSASARLSDGQAEYLSATARSALSAPPVPRPGTSFTGTLTGLGADDHAAMPAPTSFGARLGIAKMTAPGGRSRLSGAAPPGGCHFP